jgi:hypothetical protein
MSRYNTGAMLSILLSYQALIILPIASFKINRSYGYFEIFRLALNKIQSN